MDSTDGSPATSPLWYFRLCLASWLFSVRCVLWLMQRRHTHHAVRHEAHFNLRDHLYLKSCSYPEEMMLGHFGQYNTPHGAFPAAALTWTSLPFDDID
jgi:hypothetical protein